MASPTGDGPHVLCLDTPEVATGDGYSLETEHFAGLISGEKLPEVTTLEQSLNSIRLVKAEIGSIQKNSEITL